MNLKNLANKLNERSAEIIGTTQEYVGQPRGPQNDAVDQKKINAVMVYLTAKSKAGDKNAQQLLADLSPKDVKIIDMVPRLSAVGGGYGTVEITTDNDNKKYIASFDETGNCLGIKLTQ